MGNTDDQETIDLVIKGDTNAFAVLVNRYKDMVFTLSLKMLRNREEAEEVAQDSFIKTYRSLRTFKGDAKFSTWLFKVTYNGCLDRLKKLKRTEPVIAFDEYIEDGLTELSNIVDAIDERERKQLVQDCVDMLPAEESFLLTLFYFEDQSVKEIAKVIDINENNVKIKLHRSRKKLAVILKKHLTPEIINHYESEQR